MEQTSDTVLLGKLIDESSYERKDKGIDIDETIVIDWIDDKTGVLHEVKKSDSMEEAHTWQVLYYLWYLKQKGVMVQGVLHPRPISDEGRLEHGQEGVPVEGNLQQSAGSDEGCLQRGLRGEIDYPKLKQRVEVVLTPEKEAELTRVLLKVEQVMAREELPERIKKKFCKTCSYFDLCWTG